MILLGSGVPLRGGGYPFAGMFLAETLWRLGASPGASLRQGPGAKCNHQDGAGARVLLPEEFFMFNNRHVQRVGWGAVASVLLLAPQVSAQDLTSLFEYRVVEVNDAGEEMLVERNKVRPGETIHYMISHENVADSDLSDVVIVAPVPEGVTLSVGSASSSIPANFEIQAELEPEMPGLEWSTLPAFRKVVAEDGSESLEPVPAEAIEAVRWSLQTAIPSGDKAMNTYRVVVN